MNRSLWQRQEVETGITKSNRENSCSCLISYTFHCTALISIYTEMQKIILCDWSAKFLKRSPVWREIYSIWCIPFLQTYARKFKIYFRVYKAYKRVLLEPLFKVNNQKFVLLNHSCVKLTTNRFLLTPFFFFAQLQLWWTTVMPCHTLWMFRKLLRSITYSKRARGQVFI